MPDVIEHIHGSMVQHGVLNRRIYVMHLDPRRCTELIENLDALAERRRYGKILAKIPKDTWPVFEAAGYMPEAVIPGFFHGRTDAWLVAKYVSVRRRWDPAAERRRARLSAMARRARADSADGDDTGRGVIRCRPSDAEEMGALYRQVFVSYPFPIEDPAFLRRQMAAGVRYVGMRRRGRLVALAAAEIDADAGATEMTDFATVKRCRGRGMASRLLRYLDAAAPTWRMVTGYTIARAASPGMNRVFHKNGYRYAGYLPNNTQIAGNIESMTVWYKRLGGPPVPLRKPPPEIG